MLSVIEQVENREQLKNIKAFEFNWDIASSHKALLFAAMVNKEIAGLVEFSREPIELFNFMHLIEVKEQFKGSSIAGELLAWVGLDSLNQGLDGFVVFESKSRYYQYYIQKYGAKPINFKRLFFDTQATKNLINTYLGGAYEPS